MSRLSGPVSLTKIVSLGMDESDPTKSTLDVYRFNFEKPFLEATTKYYQNESKQFVAENSVVEYMKKVGAVRGRVTCSSDICRPKRDWTRKRIALGSTFTRTS